MKTPVRAEFTSPKYLHPPGNNDAFTAESFFSAYSPRLKGFIYVGANKILATGVALGTNWIGYANAILLSEIDWFDYNLTSAVPVNAFTYT
jgi:hypothetical protein